MKSLTSEEMLVVKDVKLKREPAVRWIKYKLNPFWAGHLLVYDPFFDLLMMAWYLHYNKKIKIEIEHLDFWVDVGDNIHRHHPDKVLKYYFKTEADAMAFKLMWTK